MKIVITSQGLELIVPYDQQFLLVLTTDVSEGFRVDIVFNEEEGGIGDLFATYNWQPQDGLASLYLTAKKLIDSIKE